MIGTDLAALAMVALLDGATVPDHPAALRAWFRVKIRVGLGAAVNAGLLDESVADKFAAAISQGVAK